MRFQGDHALAIDGVVGALTAAALQDELASNSPAENAWTRLKSWLNGLFGRNRLGPWS
jgi:hypothetical protein